MAERFFWATAREGRLYLPDIPPWGPLDPKRLLFRTSAEVVVLVRSGTVDRVAHTVGDLNEALEASERDAVSLYIHDSLLRDVSRRLDERRAKPADTPSEPVDAPPMPVGPPAESVAAPSMPAEVSAMSMEVPPTPVEEPAAPGDAPAGEGLSNTPGSQKTEV
jgi:hypothetical protein